MRRSRSLGFVLHHPTNCGKRTGCTVLTGSSVSAFVGGSEDGGSGRIDLVGVDVFCPGALDCLVEPHKQLRARMSVVPGRLMPLSVVLTLRKSAKGEAANFGVARGPAPGGSVRAPESCRYSCD